MILDKFDLTPLARKSASDVASRWAHSDGSGEIGFISSVSQPFCGDCVRARLSSDGKFYTYNLKRGKVLMEGNYQGGVDTILEKSDIPKE